MDDKQAIYTRFVEEIINGGRYELIPEIFDPGYVDHSAPPGAPGGLGGVEAVFRMFRGGFPDVHFTIRTMVSEGDIVATRVTGSGTNDGSFMGIPPTGRQATWGSHGIFRVRDGKIVEHWGQPDILALMTQIGAIPPSVPVRLPADPSPSTARPAAAVADPHDPSLVAGHERAVAWVYETALSRGDVSLVAEHIAPDFLDHPPAQPFEVATTGPRAITDTVSGFRTAFPDLAVAVESTVAEGDSIAVRARWTGTQRGSFFGIPPTGRSIDVESIDIFRVDRGQLVERFGIWNVIEFMGQLGLVPAGGPPGDSAAH